MPRKSIDQSLIVHTAAEIADADGLSQVTLAAIAGRLGIKSPSLYNHVQGLTGLRTGLAHYGLIQLESAGARGGREIGRGGHRRHRVRIRQLRPSASGSIRSDDVAA